jgi:hypothetical protein
VAKQLVDKGWLHFKKVLIISAALIRLVGLLRTEIDPPERNGPNQHTEVHPSS